MARSRISIIPKCNCIHYSLVTELITSTKKVLIVPTIIQKGMHANGELNGHRAAECRPAPQGLLLGENSRNGNLCTLTKTGPFVFCGIEVVENALRRLRPAGTLLLACQT